MEADSEREFREFVAARSAALTRSAYLLTEQREAAEDLLQTVLARVARRWRRIDGPPEAYVRRALFHEQSSRWRRDPGDRVRTRARRLRLRVRTLDDGLPETSVWYGNDALLSLTFDAARGTVARITAVDSGKVISVKPVDRDPGLRYMSVDLIPLSGAPPAGAIVL